MSKLIQGIHALRCYSQRSKHLYTSLKTVSSGCFVQQHLPVSSLSSSLSASYSGPTFLLSFHKNTHTSSRLSSSSFDDEDGLFGTEEEIDSFRGNRRFNDFNRRQGGDFDMFGNGNYRRRDGFGRRRQRFDNDEFGSMLEEISFNDLQPFPKDFYEESEVSSSRSEEKISQYHEQHSVTMSGKNLPKPILTFEELDIPDDIHERLKKSRFEKPTVIQSITWPIALSGRNIVGIAQTGSGKTLSFLLPAFIHMQAQPSPRSREGPICLVLCPTRELAKQCEAVAVNFLRRTRVTCLFGGGERARQISDLSSGCDLVIATPGRLVDLLQVGELALRRCTFLVLDEADRMLDMGFEPQIRKIVSQIRPDRQVTMWSATWPKEVQELARDYLKSDANPVHIKIGSADLTANRDVEQNFVICSAAKKLPTFLSKVKEILDEFYEKRRESDAQEEDGKRRSKRHPRILVFANQKLTCDRLSSDLQRSGARASALHGDLSQRQRDRVMEGFRTGFVSFMVATDVAARGLDVDDIDYVINYDCPNYSECYVHRIGRTGRAGKRGKALTFLTESDASMASEIIEIQEAIGHPVEEKLHKLDGWWRQQQRKQKGGPTPRRVWGDYRRNRTQGSYDNRRSNDYNRREFRPRSYDRDIYPRNDDDFIPTRSSS